MNLSPKRFLIILVLLSLLAVTLAACGGSKGPQIEIKDPWARPSPKMATSGAAYMIIENKGNEDDVLIGVEGDVSDAVEIHEMTIDENNVMRMRPVEGQRLVIPAKSKVELKPGGYHIMLIGLKHQLKEGEVIDLTLKFEKSGEIKVQAPVKMEGGMGG
ncbi:MAG TPA: copper chaperone PCu(A)C [Anaerolineae bacterium]|nr:copper chaperone PCu(A)C [Anaerolineae bacterium]